MLTGAFLVRVIIVFFFYRKFIVKTQDNICSDKKARLKRTVMEGKQLTMKCCYVLPSSQWIQAIFAALDLFRLAFRNIRWIRKYSWYFLSLISMK